MDIREEYEARIKKLESFIEDRGFGSKQLKKAKKLQRTANASVFLNGLIVIAGIAIWAINRN